MRGVLPIIILSIFLSISYYLYNSNVEYGKYAETLVEYREEREKFLYSSAKSPLVNSDYKIQYYDANINFKVIARVENNEDTDTLTLATSTGDSERFIDFANLIFRLGRKNFTLPVYKYLDGENKGKLFFCFLDRTNEVSTYAGGRYIDIDFDNAKRIELDFNKSYNPFCVYDKKFSCPIPSKRNYIDIKIEAGEKI